MGRTLTRLAILAPFGVVPPRSGGHRAVLEPARQLARAGVDVHLFGLGVRRFEAFRHLHSFVREVEPRLVEERAVSLWNWFDYLRRGRTGLPPLAGGVRLQRKASALLRRRCAEADVVQYEGPWLCPFVVAGPRRVLVAHNVEADLLPAGPHGAAARVRAEALEGAAWRGVDLRICLTEDDRRGLCVRYGEREAHVVPLGVDVERFAPATAAEREEARRGLGVADRFVVLFTGAWHPPNRDAAARMREWAAAAPAPLLFVVAGSVGKRCERGERLIVTGTLPGLDPWFAAADCCVNPVVGGSGANVKLLEYLSCGLPVVSTSFGARGIDVRDGEHLLLREVAAFPAALRVLCRDAELRQSLGRAGRALVVETRGWDRIAARRRALVEMALPPAPRSPAGEPAGRQSGSGGRSES
jgi:glycosyltransferase involved in cell wall biosynthesis